VASTRGRPGVTRVDPLGSFPWGVLEAGGIVAAPLAALAVSAAPVPPVVVGMGTMFI